MICRNCEKCLVMKIKEEIRDVYDWAHEKDGGAPLFRKCGKIEEIDKNVGCFARWAAKDINWQAIEKTYNKSKKVYERDVKIWLEELKEREKLQK